jgi:hypothetical protein
MHKLLPFLLCLACAPASQPGTYAKGTFRPPVRAPTFSPAEDAPHTFEPGRPAPVQPGPIPVRVLPQTPETRREPGIWAGDDQDPPGWNEPLPPIKVLDVDIPMPPEVKTQWDAVLAVWCSHIADTGMRTNHAMRLELMRRPDDVRCLAAISFHYCTLSLGERRRKEINDRERAGTANDAEILQRYRIDSVQGAARDALIRECGTPLPDWAVGLKPILESMQHGRAPKVLQ